MRIRLLGTGSPSPSLDRMSSGYVIEIGEDVIVVDHGFGAHHRLLELGIPATSVTKLFLSHLHFDHCGDYGRLVLTRWDQGGGKLPDLDVYGPAPLREMTEKLFGADGAYHPDISARTLHGASLAAHTARGGSLPRKPPQPNVVTLAPGDVVTGAGWTVETIEVNHFQPYLLPLGFRIRTSAGTLVYSGDSGPCEGLEDFARDCDVLIHMCHYLSGTVHNEEVKATCMGHMELAELAQAAGVGTLVLTHISPQFDRPGARERLVSEMSRVYRGTLIVGEDLMEIPLAPFGDPSPV